MNILDILNTCRGAQRNHKLQKITFFKIVAYEPMDIIFTNAYCFLYPPTISNFTSFTFLYKVIQNLKPWFQGNFFLLKWYTLVKSESGNSKQMFNVTIQFQQLFF